MTFSEAVQSSGRPPDGGEGRLTDEELNSLENFDTSQTSYYAHLKVARLIAEVKRFRGCAMSQFRTAVKKALGNRTSYWLAKGAGVHQGGLKTWLDGDQATLNSETLERVCGVLGLELKRRKR